MDKILDKHISCTKHYVASARYWRNNKHPDLDALSRQGMVAAYLNLAKKQLAMAELYIKGK